MSISLTTEQVKQIEVNEPKQSKELFQQYLHKHYTLKQLAEHTGMKLHHVQKYSKLYQYVARKKYYSQNRNNDQQHQIKKEYHFKICPECTSCNLVFDEIHQEVYCKKCGLVIISPPTTDFVTDGYSYLHIHTNYSRIEVIIE